MSIRKVSLMFACLGLAACAFGCGDDVGGILKCTPGDTKCEGSTLKACIGVNWISTECGNFGCEVGANGAMCKIPEGYECVVDTCADKNTLKACSDDFKVTLTPCGAGEECVVNTCVKSEGTSTECTPGEVKCSSDNMGTIKCGADGKWGNTVVCSDGQKCDINSKECSATAAVCNNGEKNCEGNIAKVCNNNEWQTEDCGNKVCNNGVCEDNSTTNTCTQEQISACEANGQSIDPANCECIDNGNSCDKSVEICNATDQDFDEANCTCIDREVQPTCDRDPAECTADNDKVLDADLCECVEKVENCDEVPNSQFEDGVCNCIEGYKKNAESKLCECSLNDETCAQTNQSFDAENCACIEIVDDKCIKDAAKCAADNDKVLDLDLCECVEKVEECTDPNSTLQDGVCVCKDGYKKNAESKLCEEIPDACNKTDADCTKDNANMKLGDDCQCVCALSDEICAKDSKTYDSDKCECVENAVATECQYDADDKKNEKKCMTAGGNNQIGTYVVCQPDGTWSKETTKCSAQMNRCDDGASKTEVCVARCTNGSNRCSLDGTRQRCDYNGNWVDNPCEHPDDTCTGSGVCECKPGATLCKQDGNGWNSGIKLFTCSDKKQWENAKSCENGQYCSTETNQCENNCKNGDKRCTDDGNFQYCNNQKWETLAVCGDKNACKQDSGCDCKEKESKCDGDTIVTCTKHNQGYGRPAYTAWEAGDKCDAGMCKVKDNKAYCSCTPDSRSCNNNKPLVCTEKGGIYSYVSTDCKQNQTCNEDLGSVCATRVCNEQGRFCYNGSIYSCDSGNYKLEEECKNGKVCQGNYQVSCGNIQNSCNSMNDGAHRCNGKQIQKCQNNQWKNDGKACADDEVCLLTEGGIMQKDTAKCVKENCKDLELQCSKDNKIQVCVSNEWKDIADCGAANLACNAGKCTK